MQENVAKNGWETKRYRTTLWLVHNLISNIVPKKIPLVWRLKLAHYVPKIGKSNKKRCLATFWPLRWCQAKYAIFLGKCDSERDRSRELSTNQMSLLLTEPRAIYQSYSREPRGIKPHFSTCTRAHMTRRYNRTDHTEIDACGSYGGSCATSFLLWEGARLVGGCRCCRSMSEAVIVSIVKVLRQ